MAKPRRIDWDKVIELLNQGLTPGAIVSNHWAAIRANPNDDKPVTRQGIVEVKKWAKRRHLLTDKALENHKGRKINLKPQKRPTIELDGAVEAIIKMAELAKRVPELEKENWTLKNKLAATNNELQILKSKEKGDVEKKLRWKQALQSGEFVNLTEHILYQPHVPEFALNIN